MKRQIQSGHRDAVAPLEALARLPGTACFPLDPVVNRCEVVAAVRAGDAVSVGDVLALGAAVVIHASLPGVVARLDDRNLVLRRAENLSPASAAPHAAPTRQELPAFAREMGLVGMGGSLFPASIKLTAAQSVHTLVINAVECEPGIEVDEALLLHDANTVRAGLTCLVEALGMERTVLAVKRASVPRTRAFAAACKADVVDMPDRYPGGAEKLIVARLEGRMPAAGVLPVHRGYLVFSVASVWALGRRLLHGEPSILRPLTLVLPGHRPRNLLVPVGTPIGHILESYGAPVDPDAHLIIAGGLMMGRRAGPETPVLKGTNAIFVQPIAKRLTQAEGPCILCGSCFDVCPLKLHPSGMADRITEKRYSPALAAQLGECFLCGACSAVCPSEIPLVQYFLKGKQWLRERA